MTALIMIMALKIVKHGLNRVYEHSRISISYL